MFDPTSRYYNVADALYSEQDGNDVLYKQRRILPQPDEGGANTEVRVKDDDRLDLIASRTLTNPLLFWRIADVNPSLDPFSLVLIPGRSLRLPENTPR